MYTLETGHTTAEVSKLTKLSLRQLQWWDEMGVVSPSLKGDGRRRLYSETDLAVIRIFATLKRKGFTLRQIRELRPAIEAGIQHPYIATDGYKVWPCVDSATLAQLAARHPGRVAVVTLQ
jgi:hypothetical protein